MKKLTALFAFFVLSITTIFAQSTTDLSAAIDKSAREISSLLPAKSEIAVVSFFSDSKELSSYISQETAKKLTQRGILKVLERNEKNMSLVDAEIEYQYSGSVSDESMVEFGNKLGAKYLVYGAFEQFGGMLQLTIQVTDVETAEIPYMTSYSITKTSQITDLLGDDMELNSAEDYLGAIARCQRKLSSIEREKSKNIQNTSSKISARYQEKINEVRSREQPVWQSTKDFTNDINTALKELETKRDTELDSVEKKEGIKYDNQAKQVEIQKDKLIKDLQNSNFTLNGNSVEIFLGKFERDGNPAYWPVSIKSLDKMVAFSYSKQYTVNDADVKTEYYKIEDARAANDFEGEINYRVQESSVKNEFEVYIVSVRVYIKSSGSTIINDNINKPAPGTISANKTVSGKSSYTPSKTTDKTTNKTESVKPVSENKVQNTVKTDVERGNGNTNTGEVKTFKNGFKFENAKNWYANKDKGTVIIRDGTINYEGRNYDVLKIDADTRGASYSQVASNNVSMNNFIKKGNTIKFKCLGDGKKWGLKFDLYNSWPNNTTFQYIFTTKKGKVTEVEVPYSKMVFADWTARKKFDMSKIVGVYLSFEDWDRTSGDCGIQIFDVRVY